MKKVVSKIFKVIGIIIGLIIALCLVFIIYHRIACMIEAKNHPSPYSFVEVDQKQMSINIEGEGDHTIVLLPGLGTAAPIYDFEPLRTELAKDNQVITIEPFGYGYSDITDKPRNIENEVEEIKAALDASGVSGPYVLMPHSIYGLDCIYFANKYPDYVEAVIGIDCTMPRTDDYYREVAPAHMSTNIDLLRQTGVTRILQWIAPESIISDNSFDTYSKENLKEQTYIGNRNGVNKNVIEQANDVSEKFAITYDLTYPSNLPLLFFTPEEVPSTGTTGQKNSVALFESYITNPDIQSVIVYDAPHYMHRTHSKEIADEVNLFLGK